MDESGDEPYRDLFGPEQEPFRLEGGLLHKPEWMRAMTLFPAEEMRLRSHWLSLIAHVANTAAESGFFSPESPDWLLWSLLSPEASVRLAIRLEVAGGLVRFGDRLYVAGWRETYRWSDDAR